MRLDNEANWDEPVFPIGVIARGGDFAANTARSWMQRGQAQLPTLPAEANGLPALFSFRSGLTLAVMADLVLMGEKPAVAFRAAHEWANLGDSGDLPPYGPNGPQRLPAGLYPEGWNTLLIADCYSPNGFKVIPTPTADVRGVFLPDADLSGTDRRRLRALWLNTVHDRMAGVCEQYLRDTRRVTFASMKAELNAGRQ